MSVLGIPGRTPGRGALVVVAGFAVLAASGLTAAVPAHASNAIGCGSVITASTTLTADVGPCPVNGLVVTASNITLDLGGHSVIGTFVTVSPNPPTNESDGVGVELSQVSGVTVTNGTIYHFAAGVRLDESFGSTITHLNVHDNVGDLGVDNADNGDGIALYASNHNLITHNIIRHDGPWDGIATLSHDGSTGTDGASYNTISYNVITDNSMPMLDGNGNPSWKQDNGVALTGPGSTNNTVDHNVIEGSSVNGVQVFPACINSYNGGIEGLGCAGTVSNDYNAITNNVVRDNGFGSPAAIAPLGDGILILAMGPRGTAEPGHETVSNNVADDNQRNGISIGSGNGADLYNFPGTTQGDNYGCSNVNAGGGNTGVPTADLCGNQHNTVDGNTATGNGEDGIDIGPKSQFNTVTRNHVANNGRDGIAAPLADQFDANSQAIPDGSGGFVTIPDTAATDNTIQGNTAAGDGRWDGRDDTPGCGNTWQSDHFVKVNQPCV